MSEPWRPVIFFSECDANGNCPLCKIDYAECPCPGPTQEDEFEYASIRGVLMARSKTEADRLFQQATDLRANNNVLWMRLAKLALEHAPKEAKAAMRTINENDRLISGIWERLAK